MIENGKTPEDLGEFSMAEVVEGVIHGKTIELTVDPGLEDGETVNVVIRRVKPVRTSGQGIRATAGGSRRCRPSSSPTSKRSFLSGNGGLTARSSGDISRR